MGKKRKCAHTMEIAIHCISQEQAALIGARFPLREREYIDARVYHSMDQDDPAPYILYVTVCNAALVRQQREALDGACSWYEYWGESNLSLMQQGDIDELEVFATWLSFQRDTLEHPWNDVLLEYATDFRGKQQARRWLEEKQADHAHWAFALCTFLDQAREQQCTLSKIAIQRMIEQIVDTLPAP